MKYFKGVFVILFFSIAIFLRAEKKPNFIIILTDDLGYNCLGCQGSQVARTPNIDSLAKNGARFTDAYVTHPFCGPSRVGLITGRYPHRFGMQNNPPFSPIHEKFGIPSSEKFISEALKENGYKTAAIGKWHIGAADYQRPNARGFDYFFGFLEGGHSYFSKYTKEEILKELKQNKYSKASDFIMRNDEYINEKDYLTDAFSREALSFIDKNKDEPFFIYLAYNAPHGPFEAKKEDLAHFAHISDKKEKTYYAMIHAVDRGVGKIVEKLKDLNIYDNTVLVFLSDNGAVGDVFLKKNTQDDPSSKNFPLKGCKRTVYEGGFRVPFIVSYNGKIKESVSKEVVSSLDLFPTFLSLAGVEIPSNLDGIDISKHLLEGAKLPEDRAVFADMGKTSSRNKEPIDALNAVRLGSWKLVSSYPRDEQKLYNIKEDISEKNNLVANYPEIIESLNKTYASWASKNVDEKFEHFSRYKFDKKEQAEILKYWKDRFDIE